MNLDTYTEAIHRLLQHRHVLHEVLRVETNNQSRKKLMIAKDSHSTRVLQEAIQHSSHPQFQLETNPAIYTKDQCGYATSLLPYFGNIRMDNLPTTPAHAIQFMHTDNIWTAFSFTDAQLPHTATRLAIHQQKGRFSDLQKKLREIYECETVIPY